MEFSLWPYSLQMNSGKASKLVQILTSFLKDAKVLIFFHFWNWNDLKLIFGACANILRLVSVHFHYYLPEGLYKKAKLTSICTTTRCPNVCKKSIERISITLYINFLWFSWDVIIQPLDDLFPQSSSRFLGIHQKQH